MPSDQEIITLLLDFLELSLIENTTLRSMIMTYRDHFPQIGNWEADLETLKRDKQQEVRRKFVALREAVNRVSDLEKAFQQFLKDNQPKGTVH